MLAVRDRQPGFHRRCFPRSERKSNFSTRPFAAEFDGGDHESALLQGAQGFRTRQADALHRSRSAEYLRFLHGAGARLLANDGELWRLLPVASAMACTFAASATGTLTALPLIMSMYSSREQRRSNTPTSCKKTLLPRCTVPEGLPPTITVTTSFGGDLRRVGRAVSRCRRENHRQLVRRLCYPHPRR